LHQLPGSQAAQRPLATALWWQGESIDYATLNARVADLSARLAGQGAPGAAG